MFRKGKMALGTFELTTISIIVSLFLIFLPLSAVVFYQLAICGWQWTAALVPTLIIFIGPYVVGYSVYRVTYDRS